MIENHISSLNTLNDHTAISNKKLLINTPVIPKRVFRPVVPFRIPYITSAFLQR